MKEGKKAHSIEDTWTEFNQHEGFPVATLQWKGTEACMDVHCKCGESTHIDGFFLNSIKCGKCGTVYACNPHIELVELDIEPEDVKVTDVD